MAEDDLDALLSSALDELDGDDDGKDAGAETTASDRRPGLAPPDVSAVSAAAAAAAESSAEAAAAATAATAASAAAASAQSPLAGFESLLGGEGGLGDGADLLKQLNDPEFAKTLEETMKMFGEGGAGLGGAGGEGPGGEGDEDIASALRSLSQAGQGMEGVDAAQTEQMGEDIMKEMMKQFESMGNKEDFEGVINNMMGSLLGKDVMYPPLKSVCEKFPEWLADNEAKLDKAEYERFGNQYQVFQKLVAVYETEPDNKTKISELFDDMQEFGQPPIEIIKELSPGLEVGPDGVPKLPGLGGAPGGAPGMPPGMPPMPPGMDPAQCAQQ